MGYFIIKWEKNPKEELVKEYKIVLKDSVGGMPHSFKVISYDDNSYLNNDGFFEVKLTENSLNKELGYLEIIPIDIFGNEGAVWRSFFNLKKEASKEPLEGENEKESDEKEKENEGDNSADNAISSNILDNDFIEKTIKIFDSSNNSKLISNVEAFFVFESYDKFFLRKLDNNKIKIPKEFSDFSFISKKYSLIKNRGALRRNVDSLSVLLYPLDKINFIHVLNFLYKELKKHSFLIFKPYLEEKDIKFIEENFVNLKDFTKVFINDFLSEDDFEQRKKLFVFILLSIFVNKYKEVNEDNWFDFCTDIFEYDEESINDNCKQYIIKGFKNFNENHPLYNYLFNDSKNNSESNPITIFNSFIKTLNEQNADNKFKLKTDYLIIYKEAILEALKFFYDNYKTFFNLLVSLNSVDSFDQEKLKRWLYSVEKLFSNDNENKNFDEFFSFHMDLFKIFNKSYSSKNALRDLLAKFYEIAEKLYKEYDLDKNYIVKK